MEKRAGVPTGPLLLAERTRVGGRGFRALIPVTGWRQAVKVNRLASRHIGRQRPPSFKVSARRTNKKLDVVYEKAETMAQKATPSEIRPLYSIDSILGVATNTNRTKNEGNFP